MTLEDKSIRNFHKQLFLQKSQCIYTKCYCEENIWMLCQHVKNSNPEFLSNLSTLFISNPNKSIPIWEQLGQKDKDCPVVWDYHVVLLLAFQNNSSYEYFVYDLDSSLPFPSRLSEYVKKALRSDSDLMSQYWRYIRVVPAKLYLENFASDRSHMKTPDGEWYAQPPSYPCISTKTCKMNLNNYISMNDDANFGTVFLLADFVEQYI